MSPPPPTYSTTFLVSLERTITKERLKRYLGATAKDLPRALRLYEYNVQLSEALYGLLHGLEVAVRNAANHALAASYGTPTWYDHSPLSQHWKQQLADAKNAVGATTPGKVIAELTFGFWVELLSRHHHNDLWVRRRLFKAFPNTSLHRKKIHERLKTIQRLRNRISHHEPVLTSSNRLYAGYDLLTLAELLECVEWVCSDTASWMKARFRYVDAGQILSDVNKMGVSL